jgi:hypothetical protein
MPFDRFYTCYLLLKYEASMHMYIAAVCSLLIVLKNKFVSLFHILLIDEAFNSSPSELFQKFVCVIMFY